VILLQRYSGGFQRLKHYKPLAKGNDTVNYCDEKGTPQWPSIAFVLKLFLGTDLFHGICHMLVGFKVMDLGKDALGAALLIGPVFPSPSSGFVCGLDI
jgi:hypothetical protein